MPQAQNGYSVVLTGFLGATWLLKAASLFPDNGPRASKSNRAPRIKKKEFLELTVSNRQQERDRLSDDENMPFRI